MKKILASIIAIFCLFSLGGCGKNKDSDAEVPSLYQKEEEKKQIINPGGSDIETRINPPDGYMRTSVREGSFADFLRKYPLKEDGSPVLLYDGRKKGNQSAHAAVFKLPIEAENLQQCADSVMRVYAEYFWSKGEFDKICFHFTDGFAAEYSKWRNGYRIVINGNKASWVKSKSYDESYDCFKKYLRMIFSYAGTLSMESEAEKINLDEIEAGDVFLQGGSPGHVVMICDICENENGEKAFLLAQGYMPAQEFHILKNPKHSDDPWYYTDEVTYPFITPEYSFDGGSLKRLCYNGREN